MCFRQEESSCHRSTSRPLLEYMWHNAVTKGFRRRRCPTHSPTYTVEQTRRFVWHSNTNDLRLCQPNATTRSPSRTRRYCLHKEVLDMATVRRFRLFRIEPRTPLVTMIELILQEEILRLFLSKIVAPCRYVHGIIPQTFSYVLHDLICTTPINMALKSGGGPSSRRSKSDCKKRSSAVSYRRSSLCAGICVVLHALEYSFL